jgi:hypothetical protein
VETFAIAIIAVLTLAVLGSIISGEPMPVPSFQPLRWDIYRAFKNRQALAEYHMKAKRPREPEIIPGRDEAAAVDRGEALRRERQAWIRTPILEEWHD